MFIYHIVNCLSHTKEDIQFLDSNFQQNISHWELVCQTVALYASKQLFCDISI